MSLLKVKRYYPRHPLLKGLVKYFWVLQTNQTVALNHKLLPVSNIDLVLNFSSPMVFHSQDRVEEAPRYSLSGIRSQPCLVNQAGKLNMLGISFFPAGVYPFLRFPLSEVTNKTIDIDSAIGSFGTNLENRFYLDGQVMNQINILEDYLLELLDPRYNPLDPTYALIKAFCTRTDSFDIDSFCDHYGISQRQLERIFRKHIGINPKLFIRLERFNRSLSQILSNEYTDFTSVAHENNYYDQAHFTKDFRSFTGCPPSQFVREKRSMKEIITF